MKTVICYETKDESVLKLVKAIEEKFHVDTVDVTKTRSANLSEYELIGFASEIEDDGFYRDIASFAANWMPRDKKIFFLYTYVVNKETYCEEIEGTAHFKNCETVGKYGCLGGNVIGGFKLFGGKTKVHPNDEEINGALKFYAKISGEEYKTITESKPEKPESKIKPEKKESKTEPEKFDSKVKSEKTESKVKKDKQEEKK